MTAIKSVKKFVREHKSEVVVTAVATAMMVMAYKEQKEAHDKLVGEMEEAGITTL